MDFEFSSKEELFNRVKPALNAKEQELKRFGYPYVKAIDIWKYLIEFKWKKSHNLNLCDVVDDILKASNVEIDKYLKNKLEKDRSRYFDDKIDVL